jgi:hypothetical protein
MFRGQFLDGKRTGKGTAVMSNKCRYTGERSRILSQMSVKISTVKYGKVDNMFDLSVHALSGNDKSDKCNINSNSNYFSINDDDSNNDNKNNLTLF